MRIILNKTICLLFALIFTVFLFTACGVDPNVKQENETAADYDVKIKKDEEEKELEGFHSYGNGKTDPVNVNGVEVNVKDFSLRAYELSYMMAQPNFEKVDDLPIDVIVQYAFSHVFFKNLNETNNKAMEYREAKENQIKEKLNLYFGRDDFDIKKSVLYNSGKDVFEMWLPEYGCNIYYTVDAVNVNGDEVKIITTFFNELKRETMLGRTTITVKIKDGKPVIDSLSSQ